MTFAARNDEITMMLGCHAAVRCRASLRAATHFVRLDGFTDLPRRITEFHLITIRDLITITATDRQEASAFLDQIGRTPLQAVADAVTVPMLALVASFVPAPANDQKAKPGDRKDKPAPMPWPAVYRELYRKATGWLEWTPEAAWNATPTEINEALVGYIAKLEAIHGDPKKADREPDPEQAARNIAEGLDSDFDRDGLRALKAQIAGGKR